MWSFFGGSQAKKDDPKKAIVNLREHISTLNKKRDYLIQQIDEQDSTARKYVTTNKTLAKTALKKKKKFETDLEKIENQMDSLETQLGAIESANLNLETMKAMKQGASAMKKIHGDFNVDKVDATMDDIREQVELSEEISEAISRPLGAEIDDDELEDELAALQQEEVENRMVNDEISTPKTRVNLPDVSGVPRLPTKAQPVEEEDEDERALRELQAQMEA